MNLRLGLAIGAALMAVSAHATVTIGFNDAAADNAATTSYEEVGFRFTPSVVFFGGSEGSFGNVSDGTIFAGTNGSTTLTSVDQRPFKLVSLDSAPNNSGAGFDSGPAAGGRFFLRLFPNLIGNAGETDLTLTYTQDGFATYTLPAGTYERVEFDLTELGPPTGLTAGTNDTLIDNLVLSPDLGPRQGAVPEPATWGMMLIGLSMAGAVLRRRHGVAGAAIG